MDFATTNVKEPAGSSTENCISTDSTKAKIHNVTDDTHALVNCNSVPSDNEIFIKQEVAEPGYNDGLITLNIVSIGIKNETSETDKDGSFNVKYEDRLTKSEVIFLPVKHYSDEDSESSNKSKANRHIKALPNHNDKYDDPSKSTFLSKNCKQQIIDCTKCNYKCTRKVDLTEHLQSHMDEKPFSCACCEYKGARKSNLLRHFRTHTGEKPFTCTYCDYKCSQKANLKKHLRYHTGEKPFSCTECDYKCYQKNQLIDHQIIHTGEKPLNCSLCDYKCIRKGDLTSHMKTHTGEKQFACIKCNYKCYRKTNLIRHMGVHSKLVYSCTFCNFGRLKQSTFITHLTKHTERNYCRKGKKNCDDKVDEVLRRFISNSTCNYEQEQVQTF